MITCKVGSSIVNCHEGEYSKSQFKEWSDKDVLRCPVCNGRYEYCHGMIAPQYFRHKDKTECNGLYGEPETPEHIKGKIMIYEWLQKIQKEVGITNLQLESYIKETKQRPDIYFEQKGRRYVIEFQCTPISTEYLKRRELYKLANINDVWVLGLENYHLYGKGKTIEESGSQLKLDVSNGVIHSDGTLINNSVKYGVLEFRKHREFTFEDLEFDGNIVLNRKKAKPYITRDVKKYQKQEERKREKRVKVAEGDAVIDDVKKLAEELRDYNRTCTNRMDVRFIGAKKKKGYSCRIEVLHNGDSTKHLYFFFDGSSVSCSQRIMINKRTGYSRFVTMGSCDYCGGDTERVKDFIKSKTDVLLVGELNE